MRYLTTMLYVTVVLLAAGVACAIDFDKPLSNARVQVNGQAGAAGPDLLDTASLGLTRIDTGEQLFCVNAAPDALVNGSTSVINKRSGEILLQLFAFSEADCTGLISEGSADRYRVVFGKPNKPLLLELVVE